MLNLKITLLIGLLIVSATPLLIEGTAIASQCTPVQDLSTHSTLKITVEDESFDGGSFGEIFEASGGDKAIKRIKLKNEGMITNLSGEIKAMQALSGVMGMASLDKDEGCYYNGENVYLIMPLLYSDVTKYLAIAENRNDYAIAQNYV